MTAQDTEIFNFDLSRRKLLAAAGIGGAAAVAASLIRTGHAEALLPSRQAADPVATPPVAGLHLQFGADASSEMVVSWHTLQPVQNPRVVLGHLDGKLDQTVEAKAASYTDAKSGQIVYAYHAKIGGLQADFPYLYRGRLRQRQLQVGHHDFCALASEALGDLLANAARGAGYDGDFAVELSHELNPSWSE